MAVWVQYTNAHAFHAILPMDVGEHDIVGVNGCIPMPHVNSKAMAKEYSQISLQWILITTQVWSYWCPYSISRSTCE